jgi:phosphatidylinositol alpha-mannosyltransferase
VQGVAPTHRAAGTTPSPSAGVIRLSGRVSDADLVGLIRGARLAVFASRYEGGALAAEEVVALGTPVVASDIPTFRELLSPPVELFGAFDELGGCCRRVLEAERPAASTLIQTRESWAGAGAAFGEVVAGASGLRSAVPARREQSETVRG